MRIYFLTLIVLTIIFFTIPCQGQRLYFVSNSGSDINQGTLSQPFKTIQKACNTATGGDTVDIMQGIYNEMITVNISGSSLKGFVTIRNHNGDTVIVDGTGLSARGMFIIAKRDYIRISGLEIRNSFKNDAIGVLIEGGCSNIEILNNKIHDISFSTNPADPVISGKNSHPVLVNGTDSSKAITNLRIEGNEVYNCRTGYSEGLTLNGNVDTFLVQQNRVHDITNIGIDIAGNYRICKSVLKDQARNGVVRNNIVYYCGSPVAAAAGIYVDGGRDAVICGNEVHHCQWGIEVGAEVIGKTTSGIYVRDNIVYSNKMSGLVIGGYSYPANSGKVINSYLYNNTTFGNDSTNDGGGELNISYVEDCRIENNLFFNTGKALMVTRNYQGNNVPKGLVMDYNLWYTSVSAEPRFDWQTGIYNSLAVFQTATGNDLHSIKENPSLTGGTIPYPDLHLTGSSPAIDAGDPLYIPGAKETDKDGNPRVVNGRADIGAYEYQSPEAILHGTGKNGIPDQIELYQNYPNPFNPGTSIGFRLSEKNFVTLKVYDTLGRECRTLVNGTRDAGTYQVSFNGSGLSSGIYYYKLTSGTTILSNKMILIK